MIKIMHRAADALLAALLPEVEAGACVGDNGKLCYCKKHKRYTVNCNGRCVVTGSC